MTRLTDVGVAVLLATILWAGGCYGERNRQEARFTRDSLQTVHVLDSLRVQTAKLDTVFVQDTIRFTQWRDRWRIFRDTLNQHTTDTLTIERVIQVADSTITACSEALQTCTDRGRVIGLQRDSLVSLNARLNRKPSRFGCVMGVTYTVGDVVDSRSWDDIPNRIGATCGFRVRLF